MQKHVKIVLPCTNEGEWLRVTVDSILAHTNYPFFEVLILANGDDLTDLSFVKSPRYCERVRLKVVKEALGVGKSINCAVVPGDATYYVLLDAHCLLEQEDWLERAISCLEGHPDACMVQPEVLHFEYKGEPGPDEPLDHSLVEYRHREYSARWAWPYDQPLDLAVVQTKPVAKTIHEGMAGGGMATFVRAETFHRLGKYDPEVSGWYPESMDYCINAWLLGRPMMVDPTIRVLHRTRTTSNYPIEPFDRIHGVLRTAYKYLSPRRRDLAEILFRGHGFGDLVDSALERILKGRWLHERAAHLRERVHDDDWLFSKFDVFEDRY